MAETEETPESMIDVTLEKDGGVVKVIKRQGEGIHFPCIGDSVYVHYVGTLEDGTQFDSSRDRGERFEFTLGKGNVIKAWDLGVASMRRGEIATLTCKPEYAYGETGSPPKIGKNATLIFEIELFDWKGEDLSDEKDGSIVRHIVTAGDGYKTPNEGSSVKIHLVGRNAGKLFEERDVEFILGDGEKEGIVPGVEQALYKFKKGEHSKLDVRSSQAFAERGCPDLGILPDVDLEYEVILHNFEKAKESWEMDTAEKLEQSQIVKAKGTTFFKQEKYAKAIGQYEKIVKFLEYETSLEGDEATQRSGLILAAYLNLAMCHLKQGKTKETIENCNKALECEPTNSKALYRRAQAYDLTNDYDLAIRDLDTLLQTEPDNKAARKQLAISRHKLSKFLDDQKKRYAGMFTKFAVQDQKNEKNREKGDEKIAEEKGDECKTTIANNGDKIDDDSISEDEPAEIMNSD